MHIQTLGEQRLRVLVVDDHADTVEATALLLKQFGAVVDAAQSGRMAIERARATSPDLVLLDLAMPEVDGYDVARALRDPPLPGNPTLVAVSGLGRAVDKARCVEAGFDLHLTKPVRPDILEQLLDSLRNARELGDKFRRLSEDHRIACRDLVLARFGMAAVMIQTAQITGSAQIRERCLVNVRKARDDAARMLARGMAWSAEDRAHLEQLLAALTKDVARIDGPPT